MLWLALYFPYLPLELASQRLSAEVSASSEITEGTVKAAAQQVRNQALVVFSHRDRVYQCNPAAQLAGIEVDATLATAHSILSDVVHVHRDQTIERKQLRQLADILYRFSSHVSIQQPDCIVMEIGGSLRLFGDHTQILTAAIELCQELGHHCVARVAKVPCIAIALARAQQDTLYDVPLNMASLELAGIDSGIIERFANMGIYTLGPLLDLPSKALGKRFGKSLLTYIGQLTGAIADPREAITPAPNFTQQIHLLKPICNKSDLYTEGLSPMDTLAHALQQWLITHQLGCEQLHWYFASHNREKICVPVRFAKAQQSAQDFLRVSQLTLDQATLPEEVLTVSLTAKRLQPWSNQSQNLFSTPTPGINTDITTVIDEFNARLGQGACHGIAVVPQHSPESAWSYVQPRTLVKHKARKQHATNNKRLSSRHNARIPTKKASKSFMTTADLLKMQFMQQTAKRPLWLFDPPRPVKSKELTILFGPERIESQWWQSEQVCRDYYIVQHKQGPECWAFIDLRSTDQHLDQTSTDTRAEQNSTASLRVVSVPSHKASQSKHSHERWYLHGYFG